MVQISPGSVTLGLSAAEALVDSVAPLHMQTETPARRVSVTAPFAVSSTEVTRGQFADFVAATGHIADGCTIRMGSNWIYDESASWRNPGFDQTDHHPVVCVSYEDAAAYADWLRQRTLNPYRLITEVEWEYIARADAGTSTPWAEAAEQACRHGNVAGATFHRLYPSTPNSLTYSCDTGFAHTAPAGRFEVNPWGLYDLFGNARERITSCWTPDHKETVLPATSNNQMDCDVTIVKGGGWSDPPANLRVPRRLRALPTARRADTGFRVVKELGFRQEAE
ncbi:MAG: formylglycine-generating enzyme family protein [Alphaproteobacteria bacterium]